MQHSFGACDIKYRKLGAGLGQAMGEQIDSETVVYTETIESVSHKAHGYVGSREKRENVQDASLEFTLAIDLDTLVDITGGRVTKDGSTEVFEGVSTRNALKDYVELEFRPKQSTGDTEVWVFNRVFLDVAKEITFTEDGKAMVKFTGEVTEDDNKKLFSVGKAMPTS